jgi:hypothetical protein
MEQVYVLPATNFLLDEEISGASSKLLLEGGLESLDAGVIVCGGGRNVVCAQEQHTGLRDRGVKLLPFLLLRQLRLRL